MSQPAAASDAAAALSPAKRRFLRYWSVNMAMVWAGGWGADAFPGFGYTETEQARMQALASQTTAAAIWVWMAAAVLIYIALAAAGMGAAMWAAFSLLWPNPDKVSEPGLLGLIVLVLVVMVGFGMPLSIGVGGALADGLNNHPTDDDPGDAALAAKITRQFRRMALVLAVLVAVAAPVWAWLAGR
jgi:hypothetical protein